MTNNTSTKKLDPTITAALIGVAGTVIVTLISVFGNRPSAVQPTPVPPTAVVYTDTVVPTAVPTDTVPAGDPTSTPEPPTNTPEPVPTATPIPAGADWPQNCISSVWNRYPSGDDAKVDDKGCLVQPVNTFYTSGGKLAFVYNDKNSNAQYVGLFTRLPSDGTAGLDVHLSQIVKGEVLMGIFESPDVNSKGVFLVVPAGKSLNEQRMLLRTMPDKKTFAQTDGPVTSSSATYDVLFDYNSGNANVKLKDNQINLGTVPLVSPEKWLFIGYQVVNGTNTLQADFSNLVITAR